MQPATKSGAKRKTIDDVRIIVHPSYHTWSGYACVRALVGVPAPAGPAQKGHQQKDHNDGADQAETAPAIIFSSVSMIASAAESDYQDNDNDKNQHGILLKSGRRLSQVRLLIGRITKIG